MKIDVVGDKSLDDPNDESAIENTSQVDLEESVDPQEKNSSHNIEIIEVTETSYENAEDFTQFDSFDTAPTIAKNEESRAQDSMIEEQKPEVAKPDASKPEELKVDISEPVTLTEPEQITPTEPKSTKEPERITPIKPESTKEPEKSTTKPSNQTKRSRTSKLKTKIKSKKSKPRTKSADTITPNSHSSNRTHKTKEFSAKKLIYPICSLVVIASLVAVAVVVINKFQPQPLDDAYFVSDDTKVSINMEPTDKDRDASSSAKSLVQTHIVYEYDGDNVTGLKTYFEYSDHDTAQSNYEVVKDQPEFEGAVVQDKYIIVTAKPESFQGLTASDVKQQEEAIRQFQSSQKQKSDSGSTKSQSDESQSGQSE